MADQIELVKQSYNKNDYEKVIDTQFTQLIQPVVDTNPTPVISVQQFFDFINNYFILSLKLET